MLKQCLDALAIAALDVDYRLFVVDDVSPNPDEMLPLYSTLNGNTKLVHNRENKGFPATANRGAAMGHSPAILFLNSDVMLQSGSVRAMLSMLWGDYSPQGMMDPAPDAPVGIVGPKLLFAEGYGMDRPAGRIQHAGIGFNGSGKPIHLNMAWSADNPKVNIARSLQAVTGAALMIRRKAWDQVAKHYRLSGDPTQGGFNEVYGKGTYEDVELCLATRAHGYKVVYEPKAVGFHHVGASALQEGVSGFDLGRNESIFKARCGQFLVWDQWMWY